MRVSALWGRLSLDRRSPDFRRSLRNALYSVADHLFLPLFWLGAAPVFVRTLGMDQYGVWMLVNALVGASGLMAFGLSDATVKFVAQYRATGDQLAVETVVRSSLTVYLALGTMAAAVIIVFAEPLMGRVFHVDPRNAETAVRALELSAFALTFRFVDSIFVAVMQGYERYDLSATINVLTNAFTFAFQLGTVLMGGGLVAIMVVALCCYVPSFIAKAIVIKRKLLPELSFTPVFDLPILKDMLRFGFYSWWLGAGGLLLGQLDRFLVASLLSTAALGHYALCLQVTQQIHVIMARAVSFVFPLATGVKERGEIVRLQRIYWKGLSFTTVGAAAIGLPLFLGAHPMLELWMGGQFADEVAPLFRMLTVVFSIYATTVVPYYLMNGAGFIRFNAISGVLNGLVAAAVTAILLPSLSLIGAALGKLAVLPWNVVSRVILHSTVFGDKRWYAGALSFMPMLIVFAVGAPLTLLGLDRAGNAWTGSAICILVGVPLGLLVAAVGCRLFHLEYGSDAGKP